MRLHDALKVVGLVATISLAVGGCGGGGTAIGGASVSTPTANPTISASPAATSPAVATSTALVTAVATTGSTTGSVAISGSSGSSNVTTTTVTTQGGSTTTTTTSSDSGNGVAGSGKVVTEPRPASGFTELALTTVGTVELAQGSNDSVAIEAEDNILPLLTSTVQQGKLTLGQQPNSSFRSTKPIVYHVTMKNVTALTAGGSGAINVSKLTADQLRVSLDGSGSTTLGQVNASTMTIQVAGSGSVTAAGSVPILDVTLDGSGKYEGQGLQSKSAKVTVRGAGGAAVQASDTLDVIIVGSGSVDYSGNPKITQQISGSGRLRQI